MVHQHIPKDIYLDDVKSKEYLKTDSDGLIIAGTGDFGALNLLTSGTLGAGAITGTSLTLTGATPTYLLHIGTDGIVVATPSLQWKGSSLVVDGNIYSDGLVTGEAGFTGLGTTEYIDDSAFNTDASWTKGTNWSISGGLAIHSAAVGTLTEASPMVSEIGSYYVIQITTSQGDGIYPMRPVLGGVNGYYTPYLSGTYYWVIRAVNTNGLSIEAEGSWRLNDVSVRKLGNGIFSDMLIRGALTVNGAVTHGEFTATGVGAPSSAAPANPTSIIGGLGASGAIFGTSSAGGSINLTGGKGGGNELGIPVTGAKGGSLNFTAGQAGRGNAPGTGGAGGDIVLNAGALNGAAGSVNGAIYLGSTTGRVRIGSATAPTTALDVTGEVTASKYTASVPAANTIGIYVDATTLPFTTKRTANYGMYVDKTADVDYNEYTQDTSTYGALNKLTVTGILTGTIGSFANYLRSFAGSNELTVTGAHDATTITTGVEEYNIGLQNKVTRSGTLTNVSNLTIYNYANYNEVNDSITYNKAANTLNIYDSIVKAKYVPANSAAAGTMNRYAYLFDVDIANTGAGSFIDLTGIRVTSSGNPFFVFTGTTYKGIELSASQGITATTGYGIYLSGMPGTAKWGFYNNVASAHNLLGLDNTYSYFGTGNDAIIYYNGTDFVFNPSVVGTGAVTIGAGAADVDYRLKFDGQTNDGIIDWMEDEDYFKYSDGILIDSTEEIFFRDTALKIFSQADGYLNIVSDTGTRLGDATPTNYTQFDSTGHQTMIGTAKPWEDLRIEPVARTTGTNAPTFEKWYDDAAGTSRGIYLYSFDDAVTNNQKEIFFTMQMPHEWDGGDIQMHVHWVPAATVNSSECIWGLEYTWKDIGEVFGDTTIVYSSGTLVPDDANITAGKHYISKFSALTPGTTADGLSSILIGRLFRFSGDASDTYTDKVGLLYIDAHYQKNSLGSTDEYTK